MKKIILFSFIILCLSGCWNYKELNNYSIVTGVAIDKDKDKYEVSVLISNSAKNNNNSESQNSQIVVYSGKGDTIFKAVKEIGLISPKELYMSHISTLILSESIAKDGVNNVVDFFLRDSNIKKNFYIAIAKDCKAKDVLKIISPLTDFPSQSVSDNLVSTTSLQSVITDINFNDLISKIIRPGISPVINSVEIIGSEKKGSSQKNIESSEPEAYIKLDTLGIFRKDKFVKWANYNESIGINIINNGITELFLKVNSNDGYVVYNTINFKTNIKIKLEDNKPIVDITSIGAARAMEVNGKINLQSDKTIEDLDKKANRVIKKYIEDAIQLSIDNRTDIFGFGLRFYQNYPHYYNKVKNDWNNNLDKIKFNIKTNIYLKNKGASQNSLENING